MNIEIPIPFFRNQYNLLLDIIDTDTESSDKIVESGIIEIGSDAEIDINIREKRATSKTAKGKKKKKDREENKTEKEKEER